MGQDLLKVFPTDIRRALVSQVNERWSDLQEIRLRLTRPIELIFDHGVEWLEKTIFTNHDRQFFLNQLSEYSLYRLQDELREGYITLAGGHRVGLAGEVSTLNGSVKSLKHITFFNIRLAKEKKHIAQAILLKLYENNYLNTLIIGPPQSGKTTLLRDLARLMASGFHHIPAQKVCIIDERSEIAASKHGIPQHDVGLRTDVLDACPKAEGMMMAIRALSPEVLIVDEIGSQRDISALIEAALAGVTVICTIHGDSLERINQRPALEEIFNQQVFERYVLLNRSEPGLARELYNAEQRRLMGAGKPWLT